MFLSCEFRRSPAWLAAPTVGGDEDALAGPGAELVLAQTRVGVGLGGFRQEVVETQGQEEEEGDKG